MNVVTQYCYDLPLIGIFYGVPIQMIPMKTITLAIDGTRFVVG